MKPPKATLLLLVKNEIEGLKTILPCIDRSLFEQIMVVDGHSTDGSYEYALSQNIEVYREKRPGIAEAVIDAYPLIRGTYVITFSPDGNSLPKLLAPMIDKIAEGYDVVVASRYLPPAKSYDDNLVTAFGNYFFTRMTRWLGKTPITDALNIFRAYRTDLLNNTEMLQFVYGPVLEPLVSAYACAVGLSIGEIAGDEPKRLSGESKMRIFYNGPCILLMLIRLHIFRLIRLSKHLWKSFFKTALIK